MLNFELSTGPSADSSQTNNAFQDEMQNHRRSQVSGGKVNEAIAADQNDSSQYIQTSSSFTDKLSTVGGAALAAGLGGDNFIHELKKAGRIPHLPGRSPDEVTQAGAKLWKKNGHIETLQLASGPVFSFSYKKGLDEPSLIVEPDGSKVQHRDKGDQFIRKNPDQKIESFNGHIRPNDDGSVWYTKDSGYQVRINPNGYRTELDHGRLMRLVDPESRKTEFVYDADGNPTKMIAPDGSIVFRSQDGKYYAHMTGIAEAQPTPYTNMSKDATTGNIMLETDQTITIYSPAGITTLKRTDKNPTAEKTVLS